MNTGKDRLSNFTPAYCWNSEGLNNWIEDVSVILNLLESNGFTISSTLELGEFSNLQRLMRFGSLPENEVVDREAGGAMSVPIVLILISWYLPTNAVPVPAPPPPIVSESFRPIPSAPVTVLMSRCTPSLTPRRRFLSPVVESNVVKNQR